MTDQSPLSAEQVLRVAALARLAISPEQADSYRVDLTAILNHAASLNSLDLTGVEPLTHPHALADRTDQDTPGPTLPNEICMNLAPESDPPFIKVPKILAPPSNS